MATDTWQAWLFDLDGVVTDTAVLHARAWKALFDAYLEERGDGQPPFALPDDYTGHVDGKPRYQGVDAFLRSRGIELPMGVPDDPPTAVTVCGLGNRKNALFAKALEDGVPVFEGTVRLIDRLLADGVKVALVTSSRNATAVLERAELTDRFELVVDGNDVLERGLTGKPAPDAFLLAAQLAGVAPEQAVVVEDALSGVEAGRRGAFGLVVGVDRGLGHEPLLAAGADRVVDDLAEFLEGTD
ncbi:MAG: beta-phosphoglucomutase family hydrolase [Pseudomonadota bacterium]